MNILGFEVSDEEVALMRQRGETPVKCYGCARVLIASRDINIPAFCDKCQPKASILKKYTNPGNIPNEQERQRIFDSVVRGGR